MPHRMVNDQPVAATHTRNLPRIQPAALRTGASPSMQLQFAAPTPSFGIVADFLSVRAPGLALAALLAYGANKLAPLTAFSPFLWASLIGIACGNFLTLVSPGSKEQLRSGVSFAKTRLLRAGIILYGVKMTVQKLALTGVAGVLADLFAVISTLFLGWLLGMRVLKLEPQLTALISSGAAICGCSAVAATQTVVKGEPHEVAAAIGTVVLCGTIAMFLYPLLWKFVPALAADAKLMGIFTGATMHEVAGVVAVGNACSADVASTALVTKLVRVCLLAPFLLCLSSVRQWGRRTLRRRSSSRSSAPLPWFAFALVAVACVNSVFTVPARMVKRAASASAFAMAMAMAANGLDADIGQIRKLGARPLMLAGALWLHLLLVGAGVTHFLVARLP